VVHTADDPRVAQLESPRCTVTRSSGCATGVTLGWGDSQRDVWTYGRTLRRHGLAGRDSPVELHGGRCCGSTRLGKARGASQGKGNHRKKKRNSSRDAESFAYLHLGTAKRDFRLVAATRYFQVGPTQHFSPAPRQQGLLSPLVASGIPGWRLANEKLAVKAV